jgi:type I restriction enzyme R subunit
VDAASSRIRQRQDAAATLIGYFDPDEPVANLIGNLPHWRQKGVTYFVTFRSADALPQGKLKQWNEELLVWLRSHPEPHDPKTRREFYERFPKRIQQWLDASYGECLLRIRENREWVETALRQFDGQRYSLDVFTVAPNHVHALVTPLSGHELSDILHSWKSYTSNQINQRHNRTGAFWQKESFDHIVRNPASLEKFREYLRAHDRVAAASSRFR